MMSALPLVSVRHNIKLCTIKLFHSSTHLLDKDLCKNSFDLHIFSFFLVFFFAHDFIIYIHYTDVAASNTATDDVTN